MKLFHLYQITFFAFFLMIVGVACGNVYAKEGNQTNGIGRDNSLYSKARGMIRSFKENGACISRQDIDFAVIHGDSILAILNEEEEYYSYFEFGNILVRAYLAQGEKRMAIASGDRMYSKAQALDHIFGKAVSLHAIGKINADNNREDTESAYGDALRLYEVCDGEIFYKVLVLADITEYCLDNENFHQAVRYIRKLALYKKEIIGNITVENILDILNFYYFLQSDNFVEAGLYMEKIERILKDLPPNLSSYYYVSKALYLELKNENTQALQLYDTCFVSDYVKNNALLCGVVMKRKAALLQRMGRKEEAYNLYFQMYTQMQSAFVKNYPKEIDHLSTKFKVDHLIYQNEVDRNLAIRYYMLGIVLCITALIVFIWLGIRKIQKLKKSVAEKDIVMRAAETAIKKKNLYLSNMSHEVRTPLNAIVGFSNLLALDEMEIKPEQQSEFYEIIKVNSAQLQKLIDDIVNFSDFEDEKVQLDIKEYEVVKICNEVLETVITSYKPKVEMSFWTDLDRLVIETDEARFRQVLINLLVNALKFTEKGSIVLKLERMQTGNRDVLISVTDTGCGVPPEKQKVIFERFEKLNDHVPGSGLGLSICRLILKHVNGKLWLDTSYTTGAKFCFTHPLKYEGK